MQTSQTGKKMTVLSGRVTQAFRHKVRMEATRLDVNASTAVVQGAELWLIHQAGICPMCDQRTVAPHPDELMAQAGVLFCPVCDEIVLYSPSPNGN
jgi:hypothetical protein